MKEWKSWFQTLLIAPHLMPQIDGNCVGGDKNSMFKLDTSDTMFTELFS